MHVGICTCICVCTKGEGGVIAATVIEAPGLEDNTHPGAGLFQCHPAANSRELTEVIDCVGGGETTCVLWLIPSTQRPSAPHLYSCTCSGSQVR